MKTLYSIICIILIATHSVWAQSDIKIMFTKGDVKVRRALDENWQKAQIGMVLKKLDTIFSGEKSQVVLVNAEGFEFTLHANSVLDIADLRKIQEKELFLFLMTQKVDRIESDETDGKIRIGNVSVVHGESKQNTQEPDAENTHIDWYVFEVNGAAALYDHAFYPNAIIKLHQVKDKYAESKDLGFAFFNMGLSFEAMDNAGQALDSYQSALNTFEAHKSEDTAKPEWIALAKEAIQRLEQD